MVDNQKVKNCLIINNKLTRQNSTPLLEGLAEKKLKVICNIQRRAIKLFNEDIARLHYNKNRLLKHTLNELIRLQIWFKVELEKSGKNV
jgi:hypothetical protein